MGAAAEHNTDGTHIGERLGDNPLGRSGVLAYVSAPGGHGVAMQDAGRTQT
jgi:hypothetical protein